MKDITKQIKDITEEIDDYCNKFYGHRNWEYNLIIDKNDESLYADTIPMSNFFIHHDNYFDSIGVFKNPHNSDGDCLCTDINDCLEDKTEGE